MSPAEKSPSPPGNILFGAYLLTGVFVFLVFVRAATTSITQDEAATYLSYIKTWNLFDITHANNHVLFSILAAPVNLLSPYSEILLRVPNIALMTVLSVILSRKASRDLRHPILFLSFFFCGSYYFTEFWGLGRGYGTALFFNTVAVLYCVNPDPIRLTKANVFLILGTLSNLSSIYLFAAFQFMLIYWLRGPRETHSVLHLLHSKRFLLLMTINAVAFLFFFYWGMSITDAKADPVFSGRTFWQSLKDSAPVIFSGLEAQIIALLLLGGSILFALTQRGFPRECVIFLALAILLSCIPAWLNGDGKDHFLTKRLWIPYWPLACLPFIAILGRVRNRALENTRFNSALAILLTTILLFGFAKQLTLAETMSWRKNYAQIHHLISTGCKPKRIRAHHLYYIEKYAISVRDC